jgi:hypothetical protein
MLSSSEKEFVQIRGKKPLWERLASNPQTLGKLTGQSDQLNYNTEKLENNEKTISETSNRFGIAAHTILPKVKLPAPLSKTEARPWGKAIFKLYRHRRKKQAK